MVKLNARQDIALLRHVRAGPYSVATHIADFVPLLSFRLHSAQRRFLLHFWCLSMIPEHSYVVPLTP